MLEEIKTERNKQKVTKCGLIWTIHTFLLLLLNRR